MPFRSDETITVLLLAAKNDSPEGYMNARYDVRSEQHVRRGVKVTYESRAGFPPRARSHHTTLHTTLKLSSINLQSKESVSAGSWVSQRERCCASRRRGFPAKEMACRWLLASSVPSARTSSRRGLAVAFASSFQIAHHDGQMDGTREAFGASGVLTGRRPSLARSLSLCFCVVIAVLMHRALPRRIVCAQSLSHPHSLDMDAVRRSSPARRR